MRIRGQYISNHLSSTIISYPALGWSSHTHISTATRTATVDLFYGFVLAWETTPTTSLFFKGGVGVQLCAIGSVQVSLATTSCERIDVSLFLVYSKSFGLSTIMLCHLHAEQLYSLQFGSLAPGKPLQEVSASIHMRFRKVPVHQQSIDC